MRLGESARKYANLHEIARICARLHDSARDCLRICESVRVCTRLYESGGHFVVLALKMWKLIINYHAKSEASSLKID